MGNPSVLTRALAIFGVSVLAAGVHSLVVPVNLVRASSGGFSVPDPVDGGVGGPDVSPEGATEGASGADAGGEAAPLAGGGPGSSVPGEPEGGAVPPAEAAGDGKISLERAASLHERAMMGDRVLFLDARVESDFADGHVSGAISMPFTRLRSGDGVGLMMDLATPGDGTLVVIYCTGGECEASEDTAILLEQLGYDNIAIMSSGFDDWAAAGLPVDIGDGGGP